MSKQKIVSIEIELKDYEPIKFTMAEAKELYEQLDALFGKKEQHIHHHRDWWYRPYYTWTNSIGVSLSPNTSTVTANTLAGYQVASSNTGMKVAYNAS